MMANNRDTAPSEAVGQYIPPPARIGWHLGALVLASLAIWLAFFWWAPRALMVPPEGGLEVTAAVMTEVRLFLGLIYGLTTVMVATLGYTLWLVWRGRKARQHALGRVKRSRQR